MRFSTSVMQKSILPWMIHCSTSGTGTSMALAMAEYGKDIFKFCAAKEERAMILNLSVSLSWLRAVCIVHVSHERWDKKDQKQYHLIDRRKSFSS